MRLLKISAAMGLLTVTACQTTVPLSPSISPGQWQEMASKDLDAVRALILSTHPGAIDEFNPGFRLWTDTGYQQARSLLPRVISYDTAMSVVRFYVTGFRDGHFSYSDNARANYPVHINGWEVEAIDGRYRVSTVMDNWPTALPPVGAELTQCDGRTPDTIIREDVMPFVDRRDLPIVRERLAASIKDLHLSGLELRVCQFRVADRNTINIDVSYHPVSEEKYFDMGSSRQGSRAVRNEFSLKDGVLWIRVANFNLQPQTPQAAELDAMLKQLAALQDVKIIVFDTRGNGGGDSSIGDRIFNAATGGLDFEHNGIENLPRTYAQWRVSDIAIVSAARAIEKSAAIFGENDEKLKQKRTFLNQLKAAQAAGQPWVIQEGGYRVSRNEVIHRLGRLRRFGGKLAVVTEANCASACLDFVDLVRQVPGAIQVGQTTSSDTLYIDMGYAELPSHNLLFMPLKVWRNRIRGNNEVLVPDVPFKIDMKDESAVRAATLIAISSIR